MASFYPENVEQIREREYPILKGTVYLDHAGTTLYPKSLIQGFSEEMTGNLFGNPHSTSQSSQLTTRRIDDVRLKVLRFFNASPDDFDVVFVANASAGIKLVADVFSDQTDGFWYGFHIDSHTSLVGVRELASQGQRCFASDQNMQDHVASLTQSSSHALSLLAYPGQSNMTGRRQSLSLCRKILDCRKTTGSRVYSLLDVASLVSTSPLDLSDSSTAPDFTVLSFYKIFGFPDLGALIMRKDTSDLFQNRRYFGGGTVDMIISHGDRWHSRKKQTLHDQLEDGTLPFHNIIALDVAFRVHNELYGSMQAVANHCSRLAKNLLQRMASLRHYNGKRVCEIYGHDDRPSGAGNGPLITFNLLDSRSEWVPKSEVTKLTAVKNIQIRSGGLCNPGGIAYHLKLTPDDMRRNFAAGQRCGDENDIMGGQPTGVLRVSLGAMSSMQDIDAFVRFLEDFYVDRSPMVTLPDSRETDGIEPHQFRIESMSIYPIKSCGAYKIPISTSWKLRPEGLAWDREWCLIHQGTGASLSQKRYPHMTLLRPTMDLERNVLKVNYGIGQAEKQLEISLSEDANEFEASDLCGSLSAKASSLCGDKVTVQVYSSPTVTSFFTEALGVPCTLARFPPSLNLRYAKAQRQPYQTQNASKMPGAFPLIDPATSTSRILLANESPILMISRSSVNRVNELIKQNGGRAVAADVFRANIVIAETPGSLHRNNEHPFAEDSWKEMTIAGLKFNVMGSCQRCQMICIDQYSGKRSDEPFATLAKTRRFDGKVFFGQHVCVSEDEEDEGSDGRILKAGDIVIPVLNRDM